MYNNNKAIQVQSCMSMYHHKNLVEMKSAIAKLDVKPGDSIPKRLIRPGTPWMSSPCIIEIAVRPKFQIFS